MATLENAIQQAADELKAKSPQPKAEVKTEIKPVEPEETQEETPAEETPSEEAPVDPNELTESELLEAKNLYLALKSPDSQGMVVAAMAQQMGLLPGQKNAPETKAEIAEARKSIKDTVAEALGPEYKFLAERMASAFEKIVEQERAEQETRFAEIQQHRVESEVTSAYEALAKETKGESRRLENRMAQLSEEVPIGNMNVQTYMRRLYAIASGERKTSPQKVADQIRRNASDVGQRTHGSAGGSTGKLELPTKKMNLNESIAWAQEQIRNGKG